jgi:hypothetical protein
MTSGSLKKQLAVLVAAVVLPLLVFAVAMMWQQLEEKRELVDRGMEATARALTLAVDGEVKASLGVLNTIGSSPLLDTGNLKSFHELCMRAMAGRQGAYVILFDAAGNALVNSRDVSNGDTALHIAAGIAANRVVQFLVERGADLQAKNKNGQTPLGVATAAPGRDTRLYYFFVGADERKATAELLRKLGATE